MRVFFICYVLYNPTNSSIRICRRERGIDMLECRMSSEPCQPCDFVQQTKPLDATQLRSDAPRMMDVGPRTFADLHDALMSAAPGDVIDLTRDIVGPANYRWVPVQLAPHVTIRGNGFSIGMPYDESRQLSMPLLDGSEAPIEGVTIDNLSIFVNITDITGDYAGAFARKVTSSNNPDGTVKRSIFTKCTAVGLIYQLEGYVGGLVGFARNTTFRYCHNGVNVTGAQYVGGIVGYAEGTLSAPVGASPSVYAVFTNCSNTGYIRSSVRTSLLAQIGGIVGSIVNGRISRCINRGAIISQSRLAGGLVGEAVSAIISGSTNKGTVQGNIEGIGGIAGVIAAGLEPSMIRSTENLGDVLLSGSDTVNIGGIVGALRDNCQVKECRNTAIVAKLADMKECNNCRNVGGIAGIIGSNAQIVDCVNNGDVFGAAFVGGILGYGAVENRSFVTGNLQTSNVKGALTDPNGNVGGLVGLAYANITISNNTVDNKKAIISGSKNVGGVVGYVGFDAPTVDTSINGQTVITNNVVRGSSISGSDASCVGVRRIVGRYDEVVSNGCRATILLLNNFAAPTIRLRGDNTGLLSVERAQVIGAVVFGSVFDNVVVPDDGTDGDYGANRLQGVNRGFPLSPPPSICGYKHSGPLFDNRSPENRLPPPEWTKTLLDPKKHPLLNP